MKPHHASRRAKDLDRDLRSCDGLPATVAGLPGARPDPQKWEAFRRKPSLRELVVNEEPKGGLVHGDLPAFADSTRQTHRGLGASGANPKAEMQALKVCAARPASAWWALVYCGSPPGLSGPRP
jgi:hypothetical protein